MHGLLNKTASVFFAALLAVLLPAPAPAGQEDSGNPERKAKGKDALEEEIEELREDDFPDLVAKDDRSELMDEFALLAEDATVELAARHKQKIGMSPSAVTVITREDIETYGGSTLTDLLRLVPGMDVVYISPSYTSVSSRLRWGYGNNYYLVLVDGREANFEVLGITAWGAQPMALEDIERIEVIRGPGSALYGANALAGVISITTRAVPERTSGWARLAGGEVGVVSAGMQAATRLGGWGFSLSTDFGESGMFSDPRSLGTRVWKIRGVAEYSWSEKERVLIDGGYALGTGSFSTTSGSIDTDTSLRVLRLAYVSEDLRGHLYWSEMPVSLEMKAPLDFNEIRLARFMPASMDAHVVDAEVQWTLPDFWDQSRGPALLLIAGGGGRLDWIGSDNMLDAETYADGNSSQYHQPGISHWQVRASAFVHSELAPADWVTVTAGLRFDYNNITDVFLSPRLAAVFRPAPGQFICLGAARSFRKPSWLETHAHLRAEFPPESPITGTAQEKFQEFLLRVVGNPDLRNEELTAFEAGYRGEFFDDRLSFSWDIYCNIYTDIVSARENIILDEQGLPDLDQSSFMYDQWTQGVYIVGSELAVRYSPSREISLLASWTYREPFGIDDHRSEDESPKNLITVGGRFRTPFGLLGSLYAFSRSDFWDRTVENPAGMFQPLLQEYRESFVLLLVRLGWRWEADGFQLEAGAKLLLPISPFAGPHFCYFERAGGDELRQMVTAYLQGSF